MYSILKSIIMSQKEPNDALYHKINVAWVNGDITDEEKIELEQLVFQYQNPQVQAPDLAKLYNRLSEKCNAMSEEIEALKASVEKLQSGGTDPADPEEPQKVKIPKWEAWDGISDKYQTGAVVKHKGKYYQNVLEGMQNTWEPGTTGVDERYWKEITKEEAEALLKAD